MGRWAKHQPKDGELILVCAHRDEETYHWYVLDQNDQGNPELLEFTRPDGSVGQAAWLCICDRCNRTYFDNPQAAVRGERYWTGDDPVIPDSSN